MCRATQVYGGEEYECQESIEKQFNLGVFYCSIDVEFRLGCGSGREIRCTFG